MKQFMLLKAPYRELICCLVPQKLFYDCFEKSIWPIIFFISVMESYKQGCFNSSNRNMMLSSISIT